MRQPYKEGATIESNKAEERAEEGARPRELGAAVEERKRCEQEITKEHHTQLATAHMITP